MSQTVTRWLTDAEQSAWRSFNTTARMIQAEMERGMAQHGLSGTDYTVLVCLSEAPGDRLRMSELAQATLLEKSRLSHQITRMERADLVRRESCPGDRRGQFAVLTGRGREVIERVAPHHVELVRSVFVDRLTPAQLDALAQILGPLAETIRSGCPREEACDDALGEDGETSVTDPG